MSDSNGACRARLEPLQGAVNSIHTERESHDLSRPGAAVQVDLSRRAATLVVGQAGAAIEIEITPTGPLPGDYFVGRFRGARIVALVRLGEDYDTVRTTDLVHLVEAEHDVRDFPRIAAVGPDGARRLRVVGGGAPARLKLYPLPQIRLAGDHVQIEEPSRGDRSGVPYESAVPSSTYAGRRPSLLDRRRRAGGARAAE